MSTKTRGSVEFDKAIPNLSDPAARLGKSVALLSLWRVGKRKPTNSDRIKLQEFYGIDPSAWDEPPAERARVEAQIPTGTESLSEIAAATVEHARQLAAVVAADLGSLAGEDDAMRRSAIQKNLATTMTQLGKLTGASDLTEAQIVRSPVFRRLMDRVAVALTPWPDAMRAVLDEIEGDS